MIEVFRTNVKNISDAKRLITLLLHHFPGNKINFDLDDCDNVLRVEGKMIAAEKVMLLVNENGFSCDVLEE